MAKRRRRNLEGDRGSERSSLEEQRSMLYRGKRGSDVKISRPGGPQPTHQIREATTRAEAATPSHREPQLTIFSLICSFSGQELPSAGVGC
jgi:hypothetical protein